MLRLDYDAESPEEAVDELRDQFAGLLDEFHTLVFSDYAKGSLAAIADLIGMARNKALRILVDTRGEHGMTLVDVSTIRARSFPVQAREVFDVPGAGDIFIATLAAAVSSGYILDQALEFANQAAGIVVQKPGTAWVTESELNQVLSGAGQCPSIGSRDVAGSGGTVSIIPYLQGSSTSDLIST